MKVAHLQIARRVKDGTATVADFAELDKDPNHYVEISKHLDDEDAAHSAKEDGDAREMLKGCFQLLCGLMRQVQDNAEAQAEMAKALTEGLKHVERLADTLARPKTREGVVELPSGEAVRMTITERRE